MTTNTPGIFGSGDPSNAMLPSLLNYNVGFASFGLTEQYQYDDASVTRSIVGSTPRISSILSLAPGGSPRTQSLDNHKPQWNPGAGPHGLTGTAGFVRSRLDRLNYSPSVSTGITTIVEVVKVQFLGATGVNALLFSANNSGTSKSLFYVRENSTTVMVMTGYFGQAGAQATVSTTISTDVWMAAIRVVDPTTFTVSIGLIMDGGGGSILWSDNTGPSGTATTATSFGFGASSGGDLASDGFTGEGAGALLFTGYNARTNTDLANLIVAWTQGVFGFV